MRRKSFLGVSLALFIVSAGCSHLPDANGRRLNIPLTVNVSDDGAGGCKIPPPPEPKVENHQSASLVWIVSPEAKFAFDAETGIKFVSGKPGTTPISPGDLAKEFVKVSSSGTAWTVVDHNKHKGHFGYDINVKVKATGKTCKLDPTVYNDGTCAAGGC